MTCQNASRLILASGSTWRQSLLERLGVDFAVAEPADEEQVIPGEEAADRARRLARAKAQSVRAQFPDGLIIGSDQVASLEGRLLHKPGAFAPALAQLRAAAGREVIFHTAVALIDAPSGRWREHLDTTRVRMRALDEATLTRYLQREPAFECAGSFRCEGLGIALLERIRSDDPTALIGLPLAWLANALRAEGIAVP